VITSYAVASSGFLLLGGRLADLLGRRRVLVAGLALYASSALAGGLAQNPEMLLGARAIQGLGGALVFPTTLALVNVTFPEGRARNRALGVWGGAGAAGLVLGVLLRNRNVMVAVGLAARFAATFGSACGARSSRRWRWAPPVPRRSAGRWPRTARTPR
jgi:MFS family permease